VNGIALGVLELKRSTVSVGEGIRQNIDNQKPEFIGHFFATMAWVMAGNESEGLRYGTTQTKEKYYLTWKEESSKYENSLHRALAQMCSKERFLELIHDFIVFDAGTKKLCRHNQYFGVKAAQPYALENRGGIIWHTQGSGKSLTMVWLAKWIRENRNISDARVLIVTDRDELDKQIEKVFKGVSEQIYRASSGADLIDKINSQTAKLFLFAFAAAMGLSISSIFAVYKMGSIVQVFFISSATFGAASLYGYTTKKNLTSMGSFLMMGLIGIVIAGVVNLFLQSSAFAFVISILAVLVFTGLTAYDTQQIKSFYDDLEGEDREKAGVIGALMLYMDFINIFIHLLQLIGDKKE
jgi:FtsH-binding integral membrane protein